MLECSNDIIRNIGVALVAGVPYVGGSLAVFLDKMLPHEIEKKYETFVKSLSHEVEQLKIQVNEQYAFSDEFVSLFNQTLDSIMGECSEIKMAMYRNILLSALDGQLDFDHSDLFSHILAKLSLEEIKWLYLTDIFERNGAQSPASYYIMQNRQKDNSLVLHVTTKLIRYKLITGSKVSGLGRMFINYINSPNDVLESTIICDQIKQESPSMRPQKILCNRRNVTV